MNITPTNIPNKYAHKFLFTNGHPHIAGKGNHASAPNPMATSTPKTVPIMLIGMTINGFLRANGIAPSEIAINPNIIDVLPFAFNSSSYNFFFNIFLSKIVAHPNPIGGMTTAKLLAVKGIILSAESPKATVIAALFTGPPKSNAIHAAITAPMNSCPF